MTFVEMALAASQHRSAIQRNNRIGVKVAVLVKATAIRRRGIASASLKRCIALLRKWQARERERVFLATLHELQLRDMGLTPQDRMREVNKPFWQA